MSVLVQKLLGSLVRQMLTALGTYLISQGWASSDDWTAVVMALTPIVVSVVWGLYQKYGSTLMQEALRALPAGADREDAARDIRLMSATEKVQTAFKA